jgi:manganese transport protein
VKHASALAKDLYQLDRADLQTSPKSLLEILRRIGPGIILASSIVGSGELIATTTLGAQVGYSALWIIILSCLIKPAVQAEIGRYTIATGETGLAAFDRVPGPRWKVSWIVWAWAVMVLMTQLQVGAMYGGVSQVMNQLVPAVPVNVWVVLFLGITLALLLGGGYERIEGLAMVKVGLFTLLTMLSALLLTRNPQYFAWSDLWSGLQFQLPGAGLSTAVAVFGSTGVGAAEMVIYPYWCIEKGYARFAGQRDETPEWRERATGWVRVMNVDILISLIIYTLATIAFYLLGAGILHGMALVPAADDMIPVLSNIYTKTLGQWSLWIFYAGAIATLYGTIFAATASNSRAFADLFRLLGFFKHGDYAARIRYRKMFVLLLCVVPASLFLLVQSPVKMIVVGGVSQALMIPVISIGTLYLRHRHLPFDLAPPAWTTVALWLATFVIVLSMTYYILSALH